MTDYREYVLSRRERISSTAVAGLVLFLVGMLFFKHLLLALLLASASFVYPKYHALIKQQRRQAELSIQFQQLLYVLSSSLSAGKSVESALHDALKDLRMLYADRRTMIIQEMEWIIQQLNNGITVERALTEFSSRTGIEDIHDFAEVLVVCKRQGGNLMEVVRKAAGMITEKLDVQREIHILTAQKKWESRLLGVAPIGFIGFLSLSSGDYLAPLYSGIGRVVMIAAVIVLGLAWWMCMKITDIRL